jgi:hypothetical protein
MNETTITVYYSIQNVGGSFGVQPSPINSADEKAIAEGEAQQTVTVTEGDLKIVVFVCGDIADDEIYRQVNQIKRIATGPILPEMRPARSRYSEVNGEGFIDGEPADDFDADNFE